MFNYETFRHTGNNVIDKLNRYLTFCHICFGSVFSFFFFNKRNKMLMMQLKPTISILRLVSRNNQNHLCGCFVPLSVPHTSQAVRVVLCFKVVRQHGSAFPLTEALATLAWRGDPAQWFWWLHRVSLVTYPSSIEEQSGFSSAALTQCWYVDHTVNGKSFSRQIPARITGLWGMQMLLVNLVHCPFFQCLLNIKAFFIYF